MTAGPPGARATAAPPSTPATDPGSISSSSTRATCAHAARCASAPATGDRAPPDGRICPGGGTAPGDGTAPGCASPPVSSTIPGDSQAPAWAGPPAARPLPVTTRCLAGLARPSQRLLRAARTGPGRSAATRRRFPGPQARWHWRTGSARRPIAASAARRAVRRASSWRAWCAADAAASSAAIVRWPASSPPIARHGHEPAGQAVRWLAGDAEQRIRHAVGGHGDGQRARAEPCGGQRGPGPAAGRPRAPPGAAGAPATSRPAADRTQPAAPYSRLATANTSARRAAPSPRPCSARPLPAASARSRATAGPGPAGRSRAASTRSVMAAKDTSTGTSNSGSPCRPAGHDQVMGDRAEGGVPGGQRHGTGRGQRGDEGLGIGRGAAPHQAGQDDLAAGKVPARVEQVRGEHPVHRPVQGVLAHQHAQPQVRCLGQAPQQHREPPTRAVSALMRWPSDDGQPAPGS